MTVAWLLALSLAQDPAQSPRSRPIELLQAKSCQAGSGIPATRVTELPTDRLVSLDELPPCLAEVMKRLQASIGQLVENPEAKAVLQVSVGRAWSQAGLMFSSPADPKIHYVDDIGPVSEMVASEWANYVSADGELGWSGLVLVVDKEVTRARLSTSPESPLGAYESLLQLEVEFFPNKQPDVPEP